MLKHLLIKSFTLILLSTFQMLIQMMDISDLEDTLIMYSFDAKAILLKI